MDAFRAVFYILSVFLLFMAIPAVRLRGELLIGGAAFGVLAFALPAIVAGF